MNVLGSIKKLLGRIWRPLDGIRKGLHLLILLTMTLFVLAGLAPAFQASRREIASCFRAV